MKVVWLHNYASRGAGMFMWDVFDRLGGQDQFQIEDAALPLISGLGTVTDLVRASRDAAKSADLVHAQYGSMVGFGASVGKKRYVVSYRGSDIYAHPGTLKQRLGGRLRVFLSWYAALGATGLVVMSYAMRKRMRRWPGLKRKPIHILPDPCGLTFWQPGEENLGERMSDRELIVVTASFQANNPIKRLEIVRKAVDLCIAAGLKIKIVELTGMSRDGVRDAIDGGDILAVASTHEGWPNIVKEALLRKKAFVSTDVSDLEHYVDLFAGSTIVEADPVDFAFAFIDALAIKAAGDIERSSKIIQFHPQVCAYKHFALYAAYGPKAS